MMIVTVMMILKILRVRFKESLRASLGFLKGFYMRDI